MITLTFPGLSVECSVQPPASGDSAAPAAKAAASGQSAYVVAGQAVTLVLPRAAVDYYRHGWQSWSLACWHPADARVPVQQPAILHPMQTDPLHAHRTDPSGAWLGAVRFDDDTVLLLGALGTDARVELAAGELRGTSEAAESPPAWLVAVGREEAVFANYAAALGERLGTAPGKPAPRVWCSWYSLYTAITEEALATILPELSALPVDTIQVDDGWQVTVGDWRPNSKFPAGMAALADRIHDTGRRAGLWLAPLITVASSELARKNPEWLLRDRRGRPVSAGFNWGEQLYALDTTNPDAMQWLRNLMITVREWGYDYLKLDFLYGGALPGVRRNDQPRESAYRDALKNIRESAGDAYLVTCGAPIVPSVGLCDALRIGPDVAEFWKSPRDEHHLCNPAIPGTRNAIRTTVHRLWLDPVVAIDPDVVYLTPEWNSLSAGERRMTQALAHVCRFIATSELPSWLEDGGVTAADLDAAFGHPDVVRRGPYRFDIDGEQFDFEPAMGLPGPRNAPDRLARAVLSFLGNRRIVMKANDALSHRAAAKRLGSVTRSSRPG